MRPPATPIRQGLFRLFCLALLILCSGCSSFDAKWKAAAQGKGGERWEGRWTSDKHVKRDGSPMGGRLRAVLQPTPQGALVADIKANWLIFASGYEMTFQPKLAGPRRSATPATREFSGAHTLPAVFGGVYRYEATLTGDHFQSSYTSSYDHGKFSMDRVRSDKDYASAHARH